MAEPIGSPPVRDSTPDEVAHHEAGHAVVGTRLGLRLVDLDTLSDPEGGHGHTNFQPPDWYRPASDREQEFVEAVVVTFLAGSIAEARFAGFTNPAASGFDLDKVARDWLRRLQRPDPEALAARARELVEANWPAIVKLAAALLPARRLSGAEALAAAGVG